MENLLSTPPKDHFPHGAWPHGAPLPDAPPEALYAAELANYIRTEAVDRARAVRLANEAERAAKGKPPAGQRENENPDEAGDEHRTVESLTAGIKVLAGELDLTPATLRGVADGTSWPSLAVLARVELHFDEDVVNWGTVNGRLRRGGVTRHPAEATATRQHKKDDDPSPGRS